MTQSQQVATTPAETAEVRTFLNADIRGYTEFTVEHGDAAAARLAGTLARVSRDVVNAHGGAVVELRGDEALAVFSSARQAIRAAIDLQNCLQAESLSNPSLPLQVGIGLDTGEALPLEGGYRGAALNLAARLCQLAGPSEILASDTVVSIARRLDGVLYSERGPALVKGFADPIRVMRVQPEAPPAAGDLTRPPGAALGDNRLPIGKFLGARPDNRLLARDRELQALCLQLDTAITGQGRAIMLVGEPGIGKTRLAQEVAVEARRRGFAVATGRCYESQSAIPYCPFLDAVAALYAAAPVSLQADGLLRWPYLARLLPESLGPAPVARGGQDEQLHVFRAVSRFLIALADLSPVALLLDDLHWADTASLNLLQHLSRETRAHRVLILGTYRDVEVGARHPLAHALRQMQREGLLARLPVRRIDRDGTAAFVREALGSDQAPDSIVDLIHGQAEGSPFFTEEILRTLVQRDEICNEVNCQGDELEAVQIPESIRSAIEERVSCLDADVQEVLRDASVLGCAFQFDDLKAMGDRTDVALEVALDVATAAGLVREIDHAGYGFSHALIQSSIYAEIPGRRRRRLHLTAGDAIERVSGSQPERRAGEIAWHFLEGDDPARALQYSLLAAKAAGRIAASSEVERHLRTALELAAEIGDQASEAHAALNMGRVLTWTGHNMEAQELFRRATDLFRAERNHVGEARATILLGTLQGRQGDARAQARAIEQVEALLSIIDHDDPTTDLAQLHCEIAEPYFSHGRYTDMLETTQRAAAMAELLHDDQILRGAKLARRTALGMLGHIREMVETSEDLARQAEAANDLFALAQSFAGIAEGSMQLGDFRRSLDYRRRELETIDRIGNPAGAAFALTNLAQISLYMGRWADAEMYGTQALERGRTTGTAWARTYALLHLGELALRRGDREQAGKLLSECVANSHPLHYLQALRYAHRTLAERDLLDGRFKEAIGRLAPVLDRPGLREQNVTYILPALGWAYLEDGDVTHAESVTTEAIERANAEENRLTLVDALRIRGMLLARQGQWVAAEAALKDALNLARSMPYPYAEARAAAQLGRLQASRDNVEQSRDSLEQAQAIFQSLGAPRDAMDVRRDLAQLPLLMQTKPTRE